jgi:hypothetical protein
MSTDESEKICHEDHEGVPTEVAVLRRFWIKNNALRADAILKNKPDQSVYVAIAMRPEWLRTIAKAASSIRFTANNWEWMTDAAKAESLAIADTLADIEAAFVPRCEVCGYSREDASLHMDHHLCGGEIPGIE